MGLRNVPFSALLLAGLVSGCAAVRGPADVEPLFEGASFAPRALPVSPEQVFALDEPMQKFLAGELAERVQRVGQAHGLFEALRDDLHIDYDTQRTRTAAETFDARSGNCLSLVIMMGAFAKALHLPLQYQEVFGLETWSRSGGIAFHSGHVNLRLGDGILDRNGGHPVLIDYLPASTPQRRETRSIGEQTVVAMYLNNRAAETLAEGDLDSAYAYAQAALRMAPSLTYAYNTLGVIYLRHGDLAPAERALRAALAREPADPKALGNLIAVVQAAGRAEEAQSLRAQLAELEPYPPFYFMDQGLVAMNRGDDRVARSLFEKELKRMPYDDEVHFALAVVNLRLGDLRHARAHMTLALENSTTPDRHDIYAAKLAHLRQLQ